MFHRLSAMTLHRIWNTMLLHVEPKFRHNHTSFKPALLVVRANIMATLAKLASTVNLLVTAATESRACKEESVNQAAHTARTYLAH